jgi:hypothetical protein
MRPTRPQRDMKSRNLRRWSAGMVVVALLYGVGHPPQVAGQPTNIPDAAFESAAPPAATATDDDSLMEQADAAELSQAEVKPISTSKTLPPTIKPTGALAEVIRLVESGVDEGVIMAFVTNSTSLFQLGVEEIIYLNDIGVPGPIITAMLQRDEVLKALPGGPTPAQAAPEPPNPAQYAPQPAAVTAPPEMVSEGPPLGENPMVDYGVPPGADAGYSVFYDSLAPYGTWVDVAGYGPCWQPTVVIANPYWRPYCDSGRWVYSDCGWYWMSGYSWGWAPFHYGRWFRHNRIGWCWAPGTVWGPSWVSWRYGGSHCGWAPLPPGAHYRAGVGLTYHGRAVSGSFGFGLGGSSYTFVDIAHFSDPHLNRHALPPQQSIQIYNRTQGVTRFSEGRRGLVNQGIPPSRVAQATGTEVHRVALRDANTTTVHGSRSEQFEGNSHTLSVYRPHFSPTSGSQSGAGARPRTDLRSPNNGPTRATGTQRSASDTLPRSTVTTIGSQSDSTRRYTTKAARPATTAQEGAPTAGSSTRATSTTRSDPATRSASPLIVRGSDRSVYANADASAGADRATPQRAATTQRSLPLTTPEWTTPTRPASAPAAPRPITPAVRTESPRQNTPTRYQAPVQRQWTAPASAPAAQPTRSYSSPPATVSSAPRPPTMESRPASSAPSAPAASAPAARSQPSSGGGKGR